MEEFEELASTRATRRKHSCSVAGKENEEVEHEAKGTQDYEEHVDLPTVTRESPLLEIPLIISLSPWWRA